MTTAKICLEQTCSTQLLKTNDYLCGKHWKQMRDKLINKCSQCDVFKESKYPLCIECNKKTNTFPTNVRTESPEPVTTPKICLEQNCSTRLLKDGDYLCSNHWKQMRGGLINKCSQCGVFKESKYPLCLECNQKTNAKTRDTGVESPEPPVRVPEKTRRYDSPKANTFSDRTVLIEEDQKAKDKRQLFHDQQRRCVYCGHEYPYDGLEIEHMIPKKLGGPDNIRNCQLACKVCNQAKGTMTDIEFRQKHARYLPQTERTPANPPINPNLLRGNA